MRKKKAVINIIFSILLELVTVVSGLIVPRLIISTFGSDTNGLINSITSFVAYITLLQTGVGSAIKAALYKPLAQKDHEKLCSIVNTSNAFFMKIGIATIIYIFILIIVFPLAITREFEWMYTASLVVIVGVSTVAQYFFGITYQMVLEADQKSYVYSVVQIITVILNTFFVVLLVNFHFSIQVVKLASAVFFVLRPIILGAYTKRKYQINRKAPINNDLISQRWDAFAQGIAYFIHSKTDVFVLTLFASLKDVSVYGVYALVTAGLSSFVNSIDKSVRSAFGNIIACEENENLRKTFESYNLCIHILATSFFATASITVFAFIEIYVKNITDAKYIQPIFGMLIIAAECIYCLRSPYNSIVYAAGKFKETKKSAMIEAIMNIVFSCLLVPFLGLSGVAIGTLVAMIYRTIAFIFFLKNHILKFTILSQIKRYGITIFIYALCVAIFSKFSYHPKNYFEWGLYSGIVFIMVGFVTLTINYIVDRNATINLVKMLLKRNKKTRISK